MTSVERGIEFQFLLDDGDQHKGVDGTPDLASHGVLTGGPKSFDAQVLLDPDGDELNPENPTS